MKSTVTGCSAAPIRRSQGLLVLAAVPLMLTGCAAFHPPLPTVQQVDLSRYTGKWYEIARYPAWFERDCTASTAEYTARPDGKIDVVNTCRREGELDVAEGVARVVDEDTNAKLKVTFFWPFAGDYWIIELGEDYQYAVIGEPTRNYLWILSRTPTMDDALYQSILSRLPELGYDPDKLIRTEQPGTANGRE